VQKENVMSGRVSIGARSFIRAGLLAVIAVAGVSNAAHASAEYRVWYFDDNFDTYDAGDVTDGWTKLVPPAWACGIVFYDPSYYRWVNSDGNTIDSDNFNKDVRVWIGKPGCSEALGIEYADDSQDFPHEIGGSYMEITTNYAFQWVDDEGGYPSCGACVGPGSITYFPEDIDWAHIVASEFKTVSPSLLDPRLQSRALRGIGQLGQHTAALFPALQAQVTNRRSAHLLADLEPSVRALEDAALRNLYDARRLVSSCLSQAELGRFADAFAACAVGGERLDAADSLVHSAQFTFQLPPR
jgi:hypothetical protein